MDGFKVFETSRIGITSALEKKWRFIMMNPKRGEKQMERKKNTHPILFCPEEVKI